MRRALLLSWLAVACAPKKTQTQTQLNGAQMNAAMANTLQSMDQARSRTELECGALDGRPVAPSEEKVFGENAAASWGAFYVDAEGQRAERFAVNQYVQVVGNLLAGHSTRKGPWTFGVIDAERGFAAAEMNGYVLVSSGLLARLTNEAELAAVLAHEMARVANGEPAKNYAKARSSACRVALQGYYLTEASAGSVPGGEEFVRNAKFGKTMKHFATTDPLDVENDPEIDHEFVKWFMTRTSDQQRLVGPQPGDEEDADKAAVKLLTAAGYDATALSKVIPLVDSRLATQRTAKLEAVKPGGKTPAFPKGLKWP